MLIKYPDGTQPFGLSPEKVQHLWSVFSRINGVFDDYSRGNYEAFVGKLLDKDSLWLECVDFPGVLYANGIRTGLSAHVHFVFYDGRLRGRDEFLINVLKWLVNMLYLEKVNAFVPEFCISLIRFLEKIGFTKEGHVRNWSRNNGKLFGVFILGMTKEEVINGRVFSAAGRRTTSNQAEYLDEQRLLQPADVGAEYPKG